MNKMAKIFLVGREEWETTDKSTGEEISGLSYIGFLPSGKPIKFTSNAEHRVYEGEAGYDESRAEDITLRTKMFGEKVSYRELTPIPKDA